MNETPLVATNMFQLSQVARDAQRACERGNTFATIALVNEALDLVQQSLLYLAEENDNDQGTLHGNSSNHE